MTENKASFYINFNVMGVCVCVCRNSHLHLAFMLLKPPSFDSFIPIKKQTFLNEGVFPFYSTKSKTLNNIYLYQISSYISTSYV